MIHENRDKVYFLKLIYIYEININLLIFIYTYYIMIIKYIKNKKKNKLFSF